MAVMREEAAKATTTALQAREAIGKAAAATARARELQQKLDEHTHHGERERAASKIAVAQLRAAAERELKRLLADQRRELELQIASIKAEEAARIAMMEDDYRRRCAELEALRSQLEAERRELWAPESPPALGEASLQWSPRRREGVWGKGPDLYTAERALAWEKMEKRREEQMKAAAATDLWGQALTSAKAFRLARRYPMDTKDTNALEALKAVPGSLVSVTGAGGLSGRLNLLGMAGAAAAGAAAVAVRVARGPARGSDRGGDTGGTTAAAAPPTSPTSTSSTTTHLRRSASAVSSARESHREVSSGSSRGSASHWERRKPQVLQVSIEPTSVGSAEVSIDYARALASNISSAGTDGGEDGASAATSAGLSHYYYERSRTLRVLTRPSRTSATEGESPVRTPVAVK